MEKLAEISTCTFLLVPHCQYSEYEGTEGGSKEAPPVVPHRKKRWSDLNTEQHPCTKHTHTHTDQHIITEIRETFLKALFQNSMVSKCS